MAGWSNRTLLRAIVDRLAGDTGTGGLLNTVSPLVTNVYARRFPVPGSSDHPYIIVYFDAISGDDTFSVEGKRVGIRVEWFARETASGVDSLEVVDKILERVTGDWIDQASGVPSYGLSRWTPTLQTGWSSTPMIFESASDESFSDGLGVIRWAALFSVIVSNPAA